MTGLSIKSSAWAITVILGCLAFAQLSRMAWRSSVLSSAQWSMLTLAAVFPGFIYQHALFPITAFLFCAMLSLDFWAQRRWHSSGLAAAAGAFLYSSGFLLIGVIAIIAIWDESKAKRISWGRIISSCGLACCGLGAVFVAHHVTVGHWNAFFLTKQKYNIRFHWPLESLADWKVTDFTSRHAIYEKATDSQTLLVAWWVIWISWICWKSRIRLLPLDRAVLVYTWVFWLVPLCLSSVTPCRAEALLAPSAILARFLSPRATCIWLMVFAVLGILLTGRFLQGSII